MSAHMQIDWLAQVKKIPQWVKVKHIIIIPEYKEPLHVLEQTLTSLSAQNFSKENIAVILATEARDPEADKTAVRLKHQFRQNFAYFWVTRHSLRANEVAGKSSNIAYAGKFAYKKCQELGWDPAWVTVTSADADANLHPSYIAYLTYKFLNDPDRHYHFYQASIMFYSNIWDVPLPIRVINTIGSMFGLSLLKQGKRLINFSSYSLSLKTVAEVGFWSVDVIPEDWNIFFKTYFAKGEKVRVEPIFLPTLVQAAQSKSFWRTMVNQYEQQKRWAWGVSDLPNVIRNYFIHTEISLVDRTMRLLNAIEVHLVWPTNWFILTLGSTIPPLVNPYFARTVLGHNLSRISSLILTLCALFLLIVIFVDAKAKPKRPAEFHKWKIPLVYLQWLSLPIVTFFLSALPGLDAHTRLLLGKRLEYRVTEKV